MLTPMQSRTLEYLRARLSTSEVCPSYAEIAAHLGLKAKSNIPKLLKRREERGFIERFPRRARAIRLISRNDLLGRDAGPVLAAARDLLDAIVEEDPERGTAIVRSAALGALDIAVAEFGA